MYSYCFFFNDTSTTEIYTLSLHDALPIYIAAWNNKGLALFALGRLDEAFVAFDKATLLAPDEPEVWYNKAIALERLGRREDAVLCQERARSLEQQLAR